MKVGLWSRVFIAIGVLLTAGVVWLDIGGLGDQVFLSSIILFFPGLMLLAMGFYAAKVRAVESASPNKMWLMVAVVLVVNLLFSLLAVMLIPDTTLFPSYSVQGVFGIVVIAVLFAIYEETLMMGFAAFLKTVGIGDYTITIVSALGFTFLHALAYPATWRMSLILGIGRTLFTAGALSTDNTDVGFLSHVLWNLGAVL